MSGPDPAGLMVRRAREAIEGVARTIEEHADEATRRPEPAPPVRAGGPPPGTPGTITLDAILETVRALGGEPTQEVVAEQLGCSERRLRQVHRGDHGLSWAELLSHAGDRNG